MTLSLPRAVADYLAADESSNPDRLADCFSDEAHVHDEKHDYRGRDQIKAWKTSTSAKYQYTVEPLTIVTEGQISTLHARLAGNFPASPVEVDFTFTIAGDKITELAIH
ncbi:MAG: hypothetical protein JWM57_133 [Phycisphaerales bacterium]|nr:hypothetical protein [Phycisphaerales bacterium]